jgi:hypothetical protein
MSSPYTKETDAIPLGNDRVDKTAKHAVENRPSLVLFYPIYNTTLVPDSH